MKTKSSLGYRFIVLMAILAIVFGSPSASLPVRAQSSSAPQAAVVDTLQLTIVNAVDNTALAPYEFKYIINLDNTGTTEQRSPADGCSPRLPNGNPNPDYPATCKWVSVAGRANHSDIYTQGDETDFPGGIFTVNGSVVHLPPNRYLISILADGYRIDGEHFTVPGSGAVEVKMQPFDLPTATVQAAVFEDMVPTNSAPDLPGERGLAGFRAHIKDYIDEVTTDVFGNPLGAEYDPTTGEYIPGTGGVVLSKCYVVANGVDVGTIAPVNNLGECPISFIAGADGDPLLGADITQTLEGDPIPVGAAIEGKVIIPNVGPNRYALSVVPPNGAGWIQTTTLEGNHDWDAWVMEGATGLDTEFVVAGEPFPATFFGFVPPVTPTSPFRAAGFNGSGSVFGEAPAVSAYIPPVGGIVGEPGVLGAKVKEINPIHRLFVSLSDVNNGDQTVYVGEYNCYAPCNLPTFNIPSVPDGDYVLGIWDEPQDFIFAVQNVSVQNGAATDAGSISMLGWWTTFEGYIFNDTDGDGFRDDGEPGIPNFPIVMRTRENSIMDRGTTGTTTDQNGYYWMESAYPMTQWLVMEAYADGFHTTGITYQADNQPTPTTIKGAGVDVNVHPVIGLGGRLDWGVQAYGADENGGIVGTVSYDVTRNELNPSYAAIEDWQPSISNLNVNLYAPVECGTHANTACDATGLYELAQDGSYAVGPLLNQYLSETWERPSGCVARNVDGVALVHGVDENALPVADDAPCLEAPMMGVQFGPMASDIGSADENFGASVDGNYGFGDGCYLVDGVTPGLFDPDTADCATGTLQSLPSNRDYLVKVEIPDDEYGRPFYQVTREEDINVANGDSFIPQVPPSACAGALHTVDLMNDGTTDGYAAVDLFGDGSVIVPASAPVDNPPFADMGGTIYEGQQKNLCDMKLVRLSEGKSIAPGFNFFTDVPLPGRFWGLLVDDLNLSANPRSLAYGEKYGIPFAPVGIYDYTNRLITTVESDYNGLFDVLLPSTNRISCPTPSGVCANLYRLVGNDPGIPGKWNANYSTQYRTISAEFEAFAGLTIPADLAPTPVAATVQTPGTQTLTPVSCTLAITQPQLLAVTAPYVNVTSSAGSFSISGFGFGANAGQVLLDGNPLVIANWSANTIDVTVPQNTPAGSHQLSIVSSGGQKTINGLTFHVLNSAPGSVSGFPTTLTVLDTFNNPPASYNFSTSWSQNAGNEYVVVNNPGPKDDYLQIRVADNTISNAWRSTSYGTSQEAYVTFIRLSGNSVANQQGLLLKYNGSGGVNGPNDSAARWVAVVIDNNNSSDTEDGSVRVFTKTTSGSPTEQLEITGPNALFSNGDQLGARALSNGTIIVYKNGSEIGRVTVNATSGMTGRIGLRFEGTGGGTTEARLDDFGGGNTTFSGSTPYSPVLFEVGPGKPFGNIQSAIDAAATQSPYRDSLVVVYPAAPDFDNPRYNGRGAYYENPIMYAPIQLQGVGPGGIRPDGSMVDGSIIDGIAFGGDTALSLNWLGKIGSLMADPDTNPTGGWSGNQDVNDGQVIYVLASATGNPSATRAGAFGSTTFKPMIDGFNIRGGDQKDLPANLSIIPGVPGSSEATVVTNQGGAIFANSYARNLQITNNLIESNSGSYGAIRIGTPNLPAPDTDNQNDNVRIAFNRILSNGSTNLAGAIGLFNGAENYEIANNDLCGNYSAEYGGAISHFGLSPNGKIHDNRIYSNHSYDEGAGIMIGGELPVNPNANYGTANGPKGSGPVDVYNNLIQSNLANDDGGGLRFLMAGNFPMNVYNNMIVNNISTDEGGGVALDDASNVRFYNNTVMNNKTTATALTSNGQHAPSGLSTGANSTQLQNTLPGGSPTFSRPLLFNDVFFNNWSGMLGVNTVNGIGVGGSGDIYPWDMGSVDGQLLTPTNSILEVATGISNPGGSNNQIGAPANPNVVSTYNVPITFTSWRANINMVGTIIVTADLTMNPSAMGDYHLASIASPARNTGAVSKSGTNAPTIDFDNQGRPGGGAFDMGADEVDGTTPGGGGGNPTLPTLAVLDNFNRSNANTLGSNWTQTVTLSNAGIRVNGNQAFCINSGLAALLCVVPASATWNNPVGGYAAHQGAAFTFANTTLNNAALVLKANTGTNPTSFIRVRYETAGGGQIVVATTTNGGGSYAPLSTFTGVAFANGDTLTAAANADGSVDVWKTTAANVTTYVGHSATSAFTGTGRIGMQLPSGGRVDNFSGGTLP